MRTPERRRPASSFRYSPLIAALACAFGTQAALATPFEVNVTGDPVEVGIGQLSLRYAILAANSSCGSAPHTISFQDGPFTVATPISIFSELPEITCPQTHIQGEGKVAVVGSFLYGGPFCGLKASSVQTRLTGLEIRNFTSSGSSGLCGVFEAVDNHVHDNYKGIYLTGAGAILTGNQVSQNTYGIYEAGGGSSISGNNDVHHNSYGIVNTVGPATISGNQVHDNSTTGIDDQFGGSLISNNILTNNLEVGISGTSNMVITGNTVSGTLSTGISTWGNATITGNTVTNNSAGIYAEGNSAIKGNTVTSSPSGIGIELQGGGTIGGPGTERNIIHSVAQAIIAYGGPLTIENNLVGTDGTSNYSGNSGIGAFFVQGEVNIIDNVVVGQTNEGIRLLNLDGTGMVSGNRIGVDANGATQGNGLALDITSAYPGPLTVNNNLVSANTGGGITVFNSQNVSISMNQVGTDVAGVTSLGGGANGISVNCSDNITISGNVVVGNAINGMDLYGLSNSTLSGNTIGGSASLANTGHGIRLETFDCFTPPQPPQLSAPDRGAKAAKAIAFENLLDGNTITHNGGDGVLVMAGNGNVITGGSIHSNGNKSINLDFYGGAVPQNFDPPDGTGGPNNRQNYPDITSASEDSGSTVVNFILTSIPSTTFEIDFYSNPQPQLPGKPGGTTWLGKKTVTTDANGLAPDVFSALGSHTHVTATASGPFGTSEFSPAVAPLVPAATVSPSSQIAFGNVVVGATSTSQSVAITSTGTGAYIIDSISTGVTAPACPGAGITLCPTGAFSCTASSMPPNTCTPGTPLESGSACTISATFHPFAIGAASTNIYVCDNTSATPRTISITGTGVPHVVTSTQSAHDFGTVSIGTQAVSPSIVVTNATSNPPATLGALTVPAPFTIASNTCGATLAAGASCNFTFAYAPTAIGTSTGTASMTVANGSPVTVTLQGSAVAAPLGQLTLPSGVDLGSAVLASAPLQHAVTMQNTGNAPVTFNSITATAPFQLSHNCPASLAPSASCTANITFDPLVYGTTTGQLTVDSTASGSPHVATLLATVSGVPYGISPSSSDYGSIPVGSSSAPRAFIISNNGDTAIPLSGVSVTGPFTLASNNCGTSLGPHSSCTAEVAFAPGQPGLAEGTVAAQIGLSGAPPATSVLSGAGTQAPAVALPSAIDFGALVLGTPAVTQSVEIRNTGNAVLTFTSSVSGPFSLSGDCGLNLLPSTACNLVITFTPSAVGEFNGSLSVVSNAPGGSRSIPVSARVQPVARPDIRVDVTTVGFGDRMIGTRSAPQRVTVTNVGGVLAQLGITPPTRDFIATSQCGATLAPGASCTTDVVFMPLAVGPRINRLQFTSDATGSPFTVDLIGRGCPPARPGRPPSCN